MYKRTHVHTRTQDLVHYNFHFFKLNNALTLGTHDAALCAMASSSSNSSAAAQSSSSTSDKIRTRKVNNVHNAVSSYHKTYYSTILISIVFEFS